jgi:hypothetical protein
LRAAPVGSTDAPEKAAIVEISSSVG